MEESHQNIKADTLPSVDDDTTSSKSAAEPCPLCITTGPPQPPLPPSDATEKDQDVDLVWIACNKCGEWYHAACLMLANGKWQATIPRKIIDEVERNFGQQGPWVNWVEWVGKWYCAPCLARSVSPSNPRPPRHPLVGTLKRATIELKDIENALRPLKRPALLPPTKAAEPVTKKARTNDEVTTSELKVERETNEAGRSRTEERAAKIPADENSELKAQSRPKRKTTQIDYHNLNDSIPTPTKNWLDLISDPEKYGRIILSGNYPTIPGRLLTRQWLESQSLPHQPSSPSPNISPTCFWGPLERVPLIVRPSDGGFSSLGGHIPGKDLTVQEVANLVDPQRMVDVIDVASQQSSQWSLQKWADYLSSNSTTQKRNPKVYNIISLEISDTELAKRVRPPRIVREIDWVDNFWNFEAGVKDARGHAKNKGKRHSKGAEGDKERQDSVQPGSIPAPLSAISPTYSQSHTSASTLVSENEVKVEKNIEEVNSNDEKKSMARAPYPKVQLYCLMGMKGAWTDWHVDFAASSVYYTIHSGSKVFFFIRPTESNLKAYAEWSGSYEKQQSTWLGDLVDEVRKVELHAGDTMIIPAGYIHAVYTPMDTIVFGGNFLHSYSIETQLRLRQIEIDTKVPQRFRFPFFDRLCWYVAERYVTELRQLRLFRPRATTYSNPPHYRILQGLSSLSNFLISQVDILQNPEMEDKRKNLVYNRIPHDVVKDAEGLARELCWRVERELKNIGLLEPDVERRAGDVVSSTKTKGMEAGKEGSHVANVFKKTPLSRTWKFSPPPWSEAKHPLETQTTTVKLPRPSYGSSEPTTEEEAKITTLSIKQSRKRIRETNDGMTVEESQESIFVERKVIWTGEEKKDVAQGNMTEIKSKEDARFLQLQ
ncbi:uncharacterized protein L203_101314 [Cryptococcus depauperatus CBS 7841]|uniref:JmjC domain-containing histone demethylation protein 1 n=1 Tax=Cryptococcus depauperatus CBS 7841 TaxID=1295531 RepID=A0AAJ8JPN1_9TREE